VAAPRTVFSLLPGGLACGLCHVRSHTQHTGRTFVMSRALGRRLARLPLYRLRYLSTRPPAVAVVSPLNNPALSYLPADCKAEFLLGENLKELLAYGPRLADAEALLWIPPGSPAVLRELVRGGHLPNLKWVHGFYAGIDPIATFAREELVSAKVPLSNGRGAFSSSLAEWSICAAMHFIKQIPRCMANRRARKWDKFVMGELRGLTLGLLGSGDIATATARLGKAFGMRTVALRRNARKPDTSGCFDLILGPYDGPVLPAHKKALFEQCHVVVCTLPGTPETFHFVGAREFDAMLPGAVFVSLGRGVAVDELALDAALRAGKLGGAALDVFEVEPLPAQSPLWDPIHGERLLISAHNADYTETCVWTVVLEPGTSAPCPCTAPTPPLPCVWLPSHF